MVDDKMHKVYYTTDGTERTNPCTHIHTPCTYVRTTLDMINTYSPDKLAHMIYYTTDGTERTNSCTHIHTKRMAYVKATIDVKLSVMNALSSLTSPYSWIC